MSLAIKNTFPLDHEQAVRILVNAKWDEQEKKVLRRAMLATLHHGFGTGIRDWWHLNDQTYPLTRWYMDNLSIGHGDDISSLIILDFLARYNDTEFNLDRQATKYREHWLSQGLDPITLEKVQT